MLSLPPPISILIALIKSYPIFYASADNFSYFSCAGLLFAFIKCKISNKISRVQRLSVSIAIWICSLVKIKSGSSKQRGISISLFVISSTRSWRSSIIIGLVLQQISSILLMYESICSLQLCWNGNCFIPQEGSAGLRRIITSIV